MKKGNIMNGALVILIGALLFYVWDLQQRYTTLSNYAHNTFKRQILQLETEKDSIKESNQTIIEASEESEARYDSLLRVYERNVIEAVFYYEEYQRAKAANDTLVHSERAIIIRDELDAERTRLIKD